MQIVLILLDAVTIKNEVLFHLDSCYDTTLHDYVVSRMSNNFCIAILSLDKIIYSLLCELTMNHEFFIIIVEDMFAYSEFDKLLINLICLFCIFCLVSFVSIVL
jgi:hypothetical protein